MRIIKNRDPQIAKMIGFDGQDLHTIEQGVRKAIEASIAYSFEPGEKAILGLSCERIATSTDRHRYKNCNKG